MAAMAKDGEVLKSLAVENRTKVVGGKNRFCSVSRYFGHAINRYSSEIFFAILKKLYIYICSIYIFFLL